MIIMLQNIYIYNMNLEKQKKTIPIANIKLLLFVLADEYMKKQIEIYFFLVRLERQQPSESLSLLLLPPPRLSKLLFLDI